MELVNIFGDIFNIINILLLIVSFCIIALTIKNRKGRIIASFFFSLFSTIELISLHLTNTFLGFNFIKKLDVNFVLAKAEVYSHQLYPYIFVIIVLACVFYFSGKQTEIIRIKYSLVKVLKIAFIAIFILVSMFNGGVFRPHKVDPHVSLYDEYKTDTTRYIAHAGGMIDGNIYTNTLEALELNYKRGFRLFELDIRKTSDEKYVAVHYWNQWASFTGFKGETPVTHDEFIKHKILGSYTPLDMNRINAWFAEHKDAVLVTDKINEPIQFSQLFIDKSRLIMELFSWEAVLKGIETGMYSAMPSEVVLKNLVGDKITILKEHDIKHIAISRNSLSKYLGLFKDLKKNNIRVYAYHINKDPQKDEEYVVKYEMGYFYGIYADKWHFGAE